MHRKKKNEKKNYIVVKNEIVYSCSLPNNCIIIIIIQ